VTRELRRELPAEPTLGESRWPPVGAVLIFLALNVALRIWLPAAGASRVPWLVPAVEAALLVVLMTSDPSAVGEHRRLRRIALALVGVLVAAALWATALLVDAGGPIARSRNPAPVDFAFPQHTTPELAPPGWRPVFLDYLHLGFTNATAFSPADVMPLTHRVKYAMLVQSTVALALLALVVARAVSAFS
jgi:hypothetical protein